MKDYKIKRKLKNFQKNEREGTRNMLFLLLGLIHFLLISWGLQFILHVVLEGTSSESFLKVACLLGYDICLAVFWNDLAFILVSSFKEQNLTNAS